METYRRKINAVLGFALVAAAGGVAAYLVTTKPEPARRDRATWVPEVELYPVHVQTFDAPVVGHGTVRAKSPLKIVPEVSGSLVYVNKDLAVGKQIEKGELLFEIDPRSYQLQVDQAQAEIKRLEAQLSRLREEEVTLEERLVVAKELLQLADRNWKRELELEPGKGTTEVELLAAETAFLRQKEQVLEYKSRLAMSPHRIGEVEALLEMQRAQLAEARRHVGKTKIYCPFDARIESISAAESQVVIVGFAIATLTNLKAVELAVGLDPGDLQWTGVWEYVRGEAGESAPPPQATIVWSVCEREYTWRGTVARLERVDETTRTARVVIEIKDAMKEVMLKDGQTRPPLSIGMFCRVEIPAEPLKGALVVPRLAVYDRTDGSASKFVYVYEPDDESSDAAEGRLSMRAVPVLRTANDMVLVSFDRSQLATVSPEADPDARTCELRPGDEIIVSPLPWAAEGMRVRRRGAARVVQVDSPGGVNSWVRLQPIDFAAPAVVAYSARAPGDL